MINLEAFGFPAPDPIVGPFNVFDARIGVSQRLIDLAALNTARPPRSTRRSQAARHPLGPRARRAGDRQPLSRGGQRRQPHRRRARAAGDRRRRCCARPRTSRRRDWSPASTCCAPTSQVQRQRQRLIVAENDVREGQAAAGPCHRPAARSADSPHRRIPFRAARRGAAGASAARRLRAPRRLSGGARIACAAAEAGRARPSAERLPSLTPRRRLRHDWPTRVTVRTRPTRWRRRCGCRSSRAAASQGADASRPSARSGNSARSTTTCAAASTLEVRSALLDVSAAAQQLDSRPDHRRPGHAGARAGARPLRAPASSDNHRGDPRAGIAGARRPRPHRGLVPAQRRQGRRSRVRSASPKKP